MSTQKERILAALLRGPATNRELNSIAFRYSARIAELRAEGHDIRTYRLPGRADGLRIYALGPLPDAEEVAA